MKQIVITGASGFVGNQLVASLKDRYKLILLDNKQIVNIQHSNITSVQCDITNPESYNGYLKGSWAIIHLASIIRINERSKKQINLMTEVNLKATVSLFNEAKRAKIPKFLFFSTNDVYEDSDKMIDENTSVSPKTHYGKTKLMAETSLLELNEGAGIQLTIFRPASLFGNNDNGSMKSLISLCKKGVIPIVGKGNNAKALCYVNDLTLATEKALLKEISKPLILNITSGNYSMTEMVDAISNVGNINVKCIHLPNFLKSSFFKRLPLFSKLASSASTKTVDASISERILDITYTKSLSEALLECKEYYQI